MNGLWLVCCSVLLAAQPMWPQVRREPPFTPPDIFDTRPIALDPTHFHLVLENDRVQVIRVRLGPREKSTIMEVPAHVMTCLTDEHTRVVYAHDKPVERTQKAGYSAWVERDEYGLENLEDKPVEWILVVPKAPESGHEPAG